MSVIHSPLIRDHVKERYALADIVHLRDFLERHGTFRFPSLPNGLFSAAELRGEARYTRYDHVWVRDNIHIAHAHLAIGRPEVAVKNVSTFMTYFRRHAERFSGIIRGEVDAAVPMNRPHVRFDGRTLDEVEEKWAHAQNDALGYFLWLYAELARRDLLRPDAEARRTLALFPLYFHAIRYWEDQDSGHWEEVRKVSASSIGVVVAALRALRLFLLEQEIEALDAPEGRVAVADLDALTAAGTEAIARILPAECVEQDPAHFRPHDAALLFLLYPLDVVGPDVQDRVLAGVTGPLLGEHGIRRYLGDSFWCADYKDKLGEQNRTADFSDDMARRDSLLTPGQEAQWCVFDPVVSIVYGLRYLAHREEADWERHVSHLNRALGQLSGPECTAGQLLCPEAYYQERDRYVPNDVTPLLWTQANLLLALHTAERVLRAGG